MQQGQGTRGKWHGKHLVAIMRMKQRWKAGGTNVRSILNSKTPPYSNPGILQSRVVNPECRNVNCHSPI
jgi:hypothetical protein